MKISKYTLEKIHDISIVTIAEKLGFRLYGMGNEGRRARCPYHGDQHPSLHFSTKRGCFKCFVCGAKGDAIKLVQDHENMSFHDACEWIIKECNITVVDDQPIPKASKVSVRTETPEPPTATIPKLCPLDPRLMTQSLGVSSEFCQALVSQGYLSREQMLHVADRYRLGMSRDGSVIFWEIDQQGHCHNGKLMHYQPDCHRDKSRTPTWAVAELKKSGSLPAAFENPHCLFGLHLTADHSRRAVPVCIVESEKTAVICSVHFPDALWLSCGGLQMFKPELLAPLVACKVILFPDTDERGDAYRAWLTIAQQASRLYTFQYPIRVSPFLELHASEDQKRRKIDLVDYLFENSG